MHAEHEGTHHVTSHHGGMGMNMHHSEHTSPEEAHAHMGTAMGGEQNEENEEPDQAASNESEDEESSAIPGMV
jgi:hypothetical protein